MDPLAAVVAGLISTAAMIVAILIYAAILDMPRLDLTTFIGSALTADVRRAREFGLLLLSAYGSVAAVVCASLWEAGIGSPTWLSGLIFGGALGILSVILVLIIIRFHPRWEPLPERPAWLVAATIWLGHLIYGLALAFVYSALTLQ